MPKPQRYVEEKFCSGLKPLFDLLWGGSGGRIISRVHELFTTFENRVLFGWCL